MVNGDCQFHTLPKGVVPAAGELYLARFGVLFLDELPEFSRLSLATLGQALGGMAPSTRPMIIAAANPCPCGWHGSDKRECTCTADMRGSYDKRCVAAMLALKRGWRAGESIEIPVAPISFADLRGETPGESSADIKARIAATLGAPS